MKQEADPSYLQSGRFLLLLLLVGMTGMSSTTIAPVLLGTFIDGLGISERQAGLVFAMEQAAYMVGLVWFSLHGYRFRRDRVATIAMWAVLLSCALTARAHTYPQLAAARMLAGLGIGVALAVLYGALAARRDPQRDYSIAGVSLLLYAAALLMLSGAMARDFGCAGLMGLSAVLAAAGLLGARRLPPRMPVQATVPAGNVQPGSTANTTALVRLGCTMLFVYAGHAALWTYQERIGLSVGLAQQNVALLLGISVLGGAAGALLALLWGRRSGLLLPQAVSYVIVICSALLLAYGHTAAAFVAGAVLIKLGWFLGLPYLQGAIATLDPSGRWNSAGGALQAAGSALGPALAAAVVVDGYSSVAWVSVSCYLICVLLSVGILARMDRRSAK